MTLLTVLRVYPSFEEEVQVVKNTTSNSDIKINPLFTSQEIIDFQQLIRRIPVADNVIEYAVTLVSKTRPDNSFSNDFVKNYIDKKITKLRTELRVQHAKELLLTDEINISSLEGIWTKSGFSSKTSFFTSFKEETGLTPKEYLHQKRFS
jgi:MoxR-like ATPase